MSYPTQNTINRAAEKQNSIQLLRGLAALTVAIGHVTLFANAGWRGHWGVDLFFVISGFVMCLVTEKSNENFFVKRVIRIVPLYWLATLILFSVALVAPNLLNDTTANIVHLLKSLFFIPFQKGQYVHPVLAVGWTLNFEMFFYLVFWLAMQINQSKRVEISSVIILALASYGVLASPENLFLKFYSSSIIVEFAIGMMFYKLYAGTTWDALSRFCQQHSTSLLILASVIMLWMSLSETPYSGAIRLVVFGLPSAAVFLAVILSLHSNRVPSGLVTLGDASYSLYLFHLFIILTFEKILGTTTSIPLLNWSLSAVSVALCIFAGILIFRYFERPTTSQLRRLLITNRFRAIRNPA